MAISVPYQKTLKRRAIARFVEENDRTPTDSELVDLINREFTNYPSVDEVGISGFDIEKPQFQSVSSAEVENTNRQALFDDMLTIGERLDTLTILLEESFRGFKGTVRRTKHTLKQLEGRLDNLLLLNGNVDQFVYGIEETFDLQDKVDFANTDASVEAGYVTIGRSGYSLLDLSEVDITTVVTAERGHIGSSNTSKIDFLKEDDGTIWEHLVYTKTKTGRVSVLIDVDLGTSAYVNDLRFTGGALAVNQHMTATVFYSLDGQTYTALEPAEIVVESDEHHFNIGLDGIKRLRVMLSKEVSDNTIAASNQFVYVFSLDSLRIYTDVYHTNNESTLICGPYELVDELGDPIYFTKATCEACVQVSDDTSVNFFLSKDKSNWEAVDPLSDSLNLVSFASGSKEGSYDFVDVTAYAGALVETVPDLDDIDLIYEAALNIYVPEEFVPEVSLRNIIIKRNIVDPALGEQTIYKAPSGWYFDQKTNQYTTTIYIDAPEGRYIDLGPTGAYLNGNLLSGEVKLNQGYTVFATSDSNWREIPSGLTTLGELKRADPLYPYNHRYLIQGYNYPGSFTAEKIYTGVDEYFGRLLVYVPPEQFNTFATGSSESFGRITSEAGFVGTSSDTRGRITGDFEIFTVDNPSGDMFFKVKVDRTDATWLNEQYDIDWLVHSDTSNLLYVKAILSTADSANSPVIDKFAVRVI